ncbi:hypothetical protein PUN28_005262 [Cardiocondyla obscurior]|uniref:Uncharacterized protein n=1 Tax=Cardiocondyla obscurior TaxID=286306 RepID=A0AAW2GIY9_9HYME
MVALNGNCLNMYCSLCVWNFNCRVCSLFSTPHFFTSFTVIKRACSRPQFRHGPRLSRETSEANRELDPFRMKRNRTATKPSAYYWSQKKVDGCKNGGHKWNGRYRRKGPLRAVNTILFVATASSLSPGAHRALAGDNFQEKFARGAAT